MLQTEINALSGAPFTNSEITLAKNIILDKTFNETKSLLEAQTIFDNAEPPVAVADVEQANRKLIRSQLIVFYDKFKDGTLAVKGGKRGTDYSNARDKETLRGEFRLNLGLPETLPSRILEDNGRRRSSSTSFTQRTY